MTAPISDADVEHLLRSLGDRDKRNDTAAQLSKVAAKAEDDLLEKLSGYAEDFVKWLNDDEPLIKAYTACILANIAFLEPGQVRVLEAGGVKPLVGLLKQSKEDTKVTLHSTAAVQNLTYKNTACCSEVLAEGGERALRKLLQHKKEDVQQFAAGALANLQLYRNKNPSSSSDGDSPPKSKMAKKISNILRRKGNSSSSSQNEQSASSSADHSHHDTQQQHLVRAAIEIQARARAMLGRKAFERERAKNRNKPRYKKFHVNDVREELNHAPAYPGSRQPPAMAGISRPGSLGPPGSLGGAPLGPLGPRGGVGNKMNVKLPPLPPGGMGSQQPLPQIVPKQPNAFNGRGMTELRGDILDPPSYPRGNPYPL